MELLGRRKFRDWLDYLIAFVLTVICAGLSALAMLRIHVNIRYASALTHLTQNQYRLADIVAWVVLGLLWAGYVMWVESSLSQGVTQARIARERGHRMPAQFAERRILGWLWEHNLHVAVGRFLKNALISLGALTVAWLSGVILRWILASSI